MYRDCIPIDTVEYRQYIGQYSGQIGGGLAKDSAKPKREGPWSIRDITQEARAMAKARSKIAGVSVGTWVNQAIMDQAKSQEDRQLPSKIIMPEEEIGPFWRWMRNKLGINEMPEGE